MPEGSLITTVVIQLPDGVLTATTDNILQDDEGYESSTEVLEAMMETLDLED